MRVTSSVIACRPVAALHGRADAVGQESPDLRRRRGGRERDALCRALGTIGADRYRQRRGGGQARRRPDHGRREGCRPQPDRSPDHDALARRSLRRHGGGRRRRCRSGNFIDHGPTVQPQPASTEFLQNDLSGALREGEAHGRAARGSRAGRRARLADRGVGREGAQDAASRRRQAEPVLRELFTQDPDDTENAQSVGQHRHLRQLPRRAPRRPDVEQRVRSDVPEQSASAPSISTSCRITASRSRTRKCWCTRSKRASRS